MAAPPLHWQSFIFDSANIKNVGNLHLVVRDQMNAIGLANAKSNEYDVNGSTTDTIVAVAFVQLDADKYMAIVMAAGVDGVALKDKLIARFKQVNFP